MYDHDVVPRVGQRTSLPEDPAVVDNCFVKQNGYLAPQLRAFPYVLPLACVDSAYSSA